MVQVLYGPLISDARGSIRGTTFSRALSGGTARAKPRPPLPQRTAQRFQQRALAIASQAWLNASAASKTNWASYAATVTLFNRLGVAFNPTGQQMFVRIGTWTVLYNWALSPPVSITPATLAGLTAPVTTGLAANPTANWDLSTTTLRIPSFVVPPTGSDQILVHLYAPSLHRQNASRFLLTNTTFIGSAGLPITIKTGFTTGFTSGQIVYFKVSLMTKDTSGRVANAQNSIVSLTVL